MQTSTPWALLGASALAALLIDPSSGRAQIKPAHPASDASAAVQVVSPEALYHGWRAEALIGQDVLGPKGEEVGQIKDILIGKDGVISAVVVEGGGFLGLGDAAFRVPWAKVDLTPGTEGIRIRIPAKMSEEYGLFDGPEVVTTGPRAFRATELIGDYVSIKGPHGFGIISDMAFDRHGKVVALLVHRDLRIGDGVYAYPFWGFGVRGWDPGLPNYDLPYDTPELASSALRVDFELFRHDEP